MTPAQFVRLRKKQIAKERKKPIFGWMQDLGNGYLSSLLHTGAEGDEYVQKQIKCAAACGEQKPNYFKVRITRVKK